MTEEELVHRVIDLYEGARNPHYVSKRIRRGTNGSISSATEDLFANYIAERIEDVDIYVNQMFTLGRKRFQPDIALVHDKKVLSVFELKQDLGWKRAQENKIEPYAQQIKDLRDQTRNIPNKFNHEKDRKVTFRGLKRNFVIISDGNISKDLQAENRALFETIEDTNRFLFLTEGNPHPNAYGKTSDERKADININEDGLREMVETVRLDIAGM
mgnify:CR=1 FL=1